MNADHAYLQTLKHVLQNGIRRPSRAKLQDGSQPDTFSVFGTQTRYDLSEGFPLLTTKKMPFKSIKAELLWFLSGSTNAKALQALGSTIWDEWMGPGGELGPIYGHQWRDFNGVDQIAQLEAGLKSDPFGRRHVISAWNPVDLPMMALPPCFLEDTKIITKTGVSAIKDIKVGDEVLSHDGTFNRVFDTMKTPYKNGAIIRLKTRGVKNVIESTPNHPHLVKDRGYVPSESINVGDCLGIPIPKCQDKIPSFKHNFKTGRSGAATKTVVWSPSLDDMFMLGYFLGDGWFNTKSNKLTFAVAEKDQVEIVPLLRKSIKVSKLKRTKTNLNNKVDKFEIATKKWAPILIEFGHKAHFKKIPHWIFELPILYIEYFLNGYLKADGCQTGKQNITTTSEILAQQLQILFLMVNRLFKTVRVPRKATCVIQGRTVNQRPYFSVVEIKDVNNLRNKGTAYAFIEGGFMWIPVIEKTKVNCPDFVYNISVETTNTYTANNIATHNCHVLSQFYVGVDNKLSCHLYQRSADLFLGKPFNVASYSLLVEMLCHVHGFQPGEFIHSIGDAHIYSNHVDQVKEQLTREPMPSPTLVIDSDAKSILDIKMEDICLLNYRSHAKITAEVAV